jgi:hypothetical protein
MAPRIKLAAYLLLALWALCLAESARAAPPQPPCWPAPRGTGSIPYWRVNDSGGVVAWYCKANGIWTRDGPGALWTDLPADWHGRLATFADAPDQILSDSWGWYVNAPITDPHYAAIKPLYDAIGAAHDGQYPSRLPQVQATDTRAYKQRQAVDGFSFVAIGTIPVGTTCDSTHSVDGYMPVARSTIKLASPFDVLPLIVYARCG